MPNARFTDGLSERLHAAATREMTTDVCKVLEQQRAGAAEVKMETHILEPSAKGIAEGIERRRKG